MSRTKGRAMSSTLFLCRSSRPDEIGPGFPTLARHTMAKAFAEGLTEQIAMIEGAQGSMN